MAWVLVDLDDTLVHTSPIYEEVRQDFGQAMAARGLGTAVEAVALLWQIDARNRVTLDVAKERLAISMYDTYCALTKQVGGTPDPAVRYECFTRLSTIVNHRYRLVWGARKVLSECVSYGHHLALYTRGDQELQRRKIQQTGIGRYFEHVVIVQKKDRGQLQNVLNQLDIPAADAWMVGDEIEADVRPALGLGIRAIRVWGYHEAEQADLPLSDWFYNVKSLHHILPILCPRMAVLR